MKRFSGFTLIELLIVVAIIAILAAIAVPNFLEAQTRSKVSRVKADQRSIATAIEAYFVDANHYPPEPGPAIDPALNTDPSAMSNLVRLTTPVAYITTTEVARDAFYSETNSFSSINSTPPRIPNYEMHSMFYVCYEQFGENRNVAPTQFSPFNGWCLASMGPNRGDDEITWVPWQEMVGNFSDPARVTWAAQTVYDPTNGTISYGDIARFGGEIPAQSQTLAGGNK